jgi:hypothetical protein
VEKRTIVISLVAASENEKAQTQFQSHNVIRHFVGLMLGVVRRRRSDLSEEELKNVWLGEASGKEHPSG